MGLATKTADLTMFIPNERTVQAINFAGTTTSFVQYTNNFFRDTDMRGASSGKSLTLSFWLKIDSIVSAGSGPQLINVTSSSTTQRYRVFISIDTSTDPDQLRLVFEYHDDNSNLIVFATPYDSIQLNNWYHILISAKVDTVANIAINDTIQTISPSTVADAFPGEITNLPTATDDTFLGTQSSYNVSQPPVLDGQLAEIWMKDRFYDITNSGTRRLFISENGKPVNLPGAPLVYLNGNHSTWTNAGSSDLGTQTLNNITTSSSSPSD
jgi:hypothetical protein